MYHSQLNDISVYTFRYLCEKTYIEVKKSNKIRKILIDCKILLNSCTRKVSKTISPIAMLLNAFPFPFLSVLIVFLFIPYIHP